MDQMVDHDAWVRAVLGVDVGASAQPSSPPPGTAKAALLARMDKVADPPSALPGQGNVFGKLRDAVRKAVAGHDPPADAIDLATAGVLKLEQLAAKAKRESDVAELEKTNPGAARAARDSFAAFDKTLGGTQVTPEALQKAKAERETKENALEAAAKALKTALAARSGVSAAQKAYDALKKDYDALAKREDAMFGQAALTAALGSGRLSPGSGKPFKPQTAEQLIAAYAKDPHMADAAMRSASTAQFPDTIAAEVGPMIDRARGGFASGADKFANPAAARDYGDKLLAMTGAVGPTYTAGLNDYLASGRQFSADGPGGRGVKPAAAQAQQRSVKLAGALVKADGTLDVDSPAAKAATGDLLYHPDAVAEPAASMNANVLKTMDTLRDPKASALLQKVGRPSGAAADTLVRKSLGRADAAPLDANASRTAVVAAMLKPVDQGEVGSCFATGPLRQRRLEDPLAVMQGYADIAGKGQFQPAKGFAQPAVTKLQADEDPIMRSYEYSLAAAGAREKNSLEQQWLTYSTSLGLDQLQHDVPMTGNATSWAQQKTKLLAAVKAGLTFTYDPTIDAPASADGSSSKGRYVVQRVRGGPITTQAEFEAAITDISLKALGLAANSPDGRKIATKISEPAFINAVCPRDYRPWELKGGGWGAETLTVMNGKAPQSAEMIPPIDPLHPPNQGARTEQVLAAMLKGTRGGTADMVTVETAGQHSFNLLPKDPSLDKLKGADDAETARKIKAELLDKGAAIKDKELAADRARTMFDEAIATNTNSLSPADLALVKHEADRLRPGGPLKPNALADLVIQAMAPYYEIVAESWTVDWENKEVAAGRPVTPAKRAAHKLALKEGYKQEPRNATVKAITKDVVLPEVVVADSNWGDNGQHTLFVMAPDPLSGELRMWSKAEPPGELVPLERSWVDRQWNTLK